MRYVLFALLLLMTTSFSNEDIGMGKNNKEFYLYTYYTVYRFQAVPFKTLQFGKSSVYYLDGTGKKIPVEHIILKDRKYYVHLEGDLKMDND